MSKLKIADNIIIDEDGKVPFEAFENVETGLRTNNIASISASGTMTHGAMKLTVTRTGDDVTITLGAG